MDKNGWQPIETAPKDDYRRVLLYRKGWQEDCSAGFYSSTFDAWVIAGSSNLFTCPTHWMPLPPPPGDTNG